MPRRFSRIRASWANLRQRINDGPDAGLSVCGMIAMQVDPEGRFAGTLTRSDSGTIPLNGKFAGRSIHYAFDLGSGATLSGTGALPDPCGDPVTGNAKAAACGPRRLGNFIWGSCQ